MTLSTLEMPNSVVRWNMDSVNLLYIHILFIFIKISLQLINYFYLIKFAIL